MGPGTLRLHLIHFSEAAVADLFETAEDLERIDLVKYIGLEWGWCPLDLPKLDHCHDACHAASRRPSSARWHTPQHMLSIYKSATGCAVSC